MVGAERQSARTSKITNDGLSRSGTRCFMAVSIWQQWASEDCWHTRKVAVVDINSCAL